MNNHLNQPPRHRVGCICQRCEALRDAEALERLFANMTEAEKAEAAGVVVTRAIVAAREGRQ